MLFVFKNNSSLSVANTNGMELVAEILPCIDIQFLNNNPSKNNIIEGLKHSKFFEDNVIFIVRLIGIIDYHMRISEKFALN